MRLAEGMAKLQTETAFDVLRRASELQAEGRDVINLGIGQPDFPTPEHIVEAGAKALRDGWHGYTPASGLPQLREAVAEDILTRRGAQVSPERILITPGGKPTMFAAILMLGGPGVEMIYPDPGFPIYRSMIAASGATPVPVALRQAHGFAMRAEDVAAAMTQSTRLIILNSPGNPTGGVTPKEEMDALAALVAARPDVALLSDEIYARMLYDGAAHVSALSYPEIADQVILLDGWSKTYAMTGWRLGYGVWPSALIEPAIHLAVNAWSCVNAAAQLAGIAALQGPQQPVDAMMAAFAARRRITVDGLRALPGVTCAEPGGAFYAFADVSSAGLTGREMQSRLLEDHGVATIAGPSFGDAADGCVRISYANSADAITEALTRMAALLDEVSA